MTVVEREVFPYAFFLVCKTHKHLPHPTEREKGLGLFDYP